MASGSSNGENVEIVPAEASKDLAIAQGLPPMYTPVTEQGCPESFNELHLASSGQ
ncbi:uncharacterized protein SETTUDRAFT_27834 [Exserohilum turcica Et28A]|uniref:Uncharacterized protein n=1 Tax=Exserohilum turcicum (strain 28A) TaxID=671987 RepID=R0KIM5_EXST2|nr:uncharacterized protein SETTUDRAFT_27834 [Exserohilum turcica Et28A]EOA87897.1 hypothetical protein SETTUDRAFT_27834 [Exserohilum turcica Et28A]